MLSSIYFHFRKRNKKGEKRIKDPFQEDVGTCSVIRKKQLFPFVAIRLFPKRKWTSTKSDLTTMAIAAGRGLHIHQGGIY